MTLACGTILALTAPSFALGEYSWLYAIAIPTAAAMAASVPLQNTLLLALGTLAAFGYVTGRRATYKDQVHAVLAKPRV